MHLLVLYLQDFKLSKRCEMKLDHVASLEDKVDAFIKLELIV